MEHSNSPCAFVPKETLGGMLTYNCCDRHPASGDHSVQSLPVAPH